MLTLDWKRARAALVIPAIAFLVTVTAAAQDRPYWDRSDRYGDQPATVESSRGPGPYGNARSDTYRPAPPVDAYDRSPEPYRSDPYQPARPAPRQNDAYVPPAREPGWDRDRQPDAYRPNHGSGYGREPGYGNGPGGHGRPYAPPPGEYAAPEYGAPPPPPGPYASNQRDYQHWDERRGHTTYSKNEVVDTGHRFFGSISQGLASAVEWAFQQAGRPNGYVLGEDAGGAFIAGLRYGEGRLYTKDAGTHRVYWQGPSLGYDFGGEGSKTMVLVYHMRDPSEIYGRFGGVQGAAYLVGGVSVQFQKKGDMSLAVIRSGIGLRLGANVGYLKYTRTPTWNPF